MVAPKKERRWPEIEKQEDHIPEYHVWNLPISAIGRGAFLSKPHGGHRVPGNQGKAWTISGLSLSQMCPAIRSEIYRILRHMRSKTDLARITHRLALAGTLPVVFLPLSPVLHGNTLRIKKPHIRTKLASRRYRVPDKSKIFYFYPTVKRFCQF